MGVWRLWVCGVVRRACVFGGSALCVGGPVIVCGGRFWCCFVARVEYMMSVGVGVVWVALCCYCCVLCAVAGVCRAAACDVLAWWSG